MKRRLTRGHGIPVSMAFWGFVCGAAYIMCVASYVIPEWSVERWLLP